MRLRVQPRFQIDRNGIRARIGDKVQFDLDPEKPWKHPSVGVIVKWDGANVATVRYSGGQYDGPKPVLFDLGSHEFEVVSIGNVTRRVFTSARRGVRRGGNV